MNKNVVLVVRVVGLVDCVSPVVPRTVGNSDVPRGRLELGQGQRVAKRGLGLSIRLRRAVPLLGL